ncbi:MAG: tRNA (guanine(26)-N(2))-dimethyltransferase [Aquificaceae bacterium]|nr:tRNA (guanine(26)-N(2))-dimethyltransferase [Aquificaceae bacterium]
MIKEGKAVLDIEIPKVVSSKMGVFYNPKMRINRDITIFILSKVSRNLRICDPLGASGIRSLRILLELSNVKELIYNDIDKKACEFFRRMLSLNGLDSAPVKIYCADASYLLGSIRGFDYIDIDPFGSPVGFLQSAIISLNRHGLLAVSATDTSVLSGTYPQVCKRRYGASPLLEAEFYHEIGLRILIKRVIEEGAKLDFAMRPLLAYSHLHYMRAFFIKDIGSKRADAQTEKIGYILFCPSCIFRDRVSLDEIYTTCPICSSRLKLAGPLWIGQILDRDILHQETNLPTISKEALRLLEMLKLESLKTSVGFYTIPALCKKLKIPQPPPLHFLIDLLEGSRTHMHPQGIRTDLEPTEIIRRLSEWSLKSS